MSVVAVCDPNEKTVPDKIDVEDIEMGNPAENSNNEVQRKQKAQSRDMEPEKVENMDDVNVSKQAVISQEEKVSEIPEKH